MQAIRNAPQIDPRIAERVEHFLYRVPEEHYDFEINPNDRQNLIQHPPKTTTFTQYAAN
ncbi:hypothetical protein J3R74_002157 [Puniceicoccus vermicola]|uniref:Uncharacterized protein n=1 Tax=Puniceicoccus vermicola TaxID=388746 RepID=A0A7X1B4M1_9BACT|nr:hypothetical protein [Puniceicoccus vermicola]MBC2604423.1 hypothetical protein [Puniceicoccus vermicola]